MNKYSFCLLAAIISLSVFSCKKSTKATPKPVVDSPVVYDNYTELAVGNYWIYQDYELDSVNGAAHALGTFDSFFIDKDTIINGNTYYKYWSVNIGASPSSPGYYVSAFLRDSLSYTVGNYGGIVFSSTDFTTVFRTDTLYPGPASPDTQVVTFQMGFKDSSITVDAGSFVTSAYREIFHYPDAYQPFGPTREYDHRYCKSIGLISYTTGFYFSTPNIWERRLVRYHIQQ